MTTPYFPDEILVLVFRNLIPDTKPYEKVDFQTLANISRLCKQWHRVVEPYLYWHVRGGRHGRSARLHEALATNPNLGPHTVSLDASYTALTERLQPEDSKRLRLLQKLRVFPTFDPYYKVMFSEVLQHTPNLVRLDVFKSKKNLEQGQVPLWLLLVNGYVSLGPANLRLPPSISVFGQMKQINAELHKVPLLSLHSVFRLPSIQVLNFKGGKLECDAVHSAFLTIHNQRDIQAWRFTNRAIIALTWVGMQPSADVHNFMLVAKTMPNLHQLRIAGTKNRGFGANAFNGILHAFRHIIHGPNSKLYHIQLWDEEHTPKRWMPNLFRHCTLDLLYRSQHVREVVLDSSLLSGLVVSQHPVPLSRSIKLLNIRSTARPQSGSQLKLKLALMEVYRQTTREDCGLELVMLDLQETDIMVKDYVETIVEAMKRSGVHAKCRYREKKATLQRMRDALPI